MTRLSLPLASALLVLALPTLAGTPSFDDAAYRKHIEVLASDAFEGRAADK